MARQKRKSSFALGMVIYAVVFLAVTAAGLSVFWDFIDFYERSRPKNTMDQYLSQLTVEDMAANGGEWVQQLDRNLQSEADFTGAIGESLTGKLTYARKSSVCTETSQTYVLRCGSRVIGETVIQAAEPDRYGFTVWSVEKESFDFSHLLCEPQAVTVPESYCVTANGVTLGSGYISETGIIYSALEEFYDDYPQLPTMVKYTAGSVLGELKLEVFDSTGKKLENWEQTDPNTVLENCSAEDEQLIEAFMGKFLESYVRFTGSTKKSAANNYYTLRGHYLIPGSPLADRLYTALDGLTYAQNYNDKLMQVEIHRMMQTEESRYFCDATYVVSTAGKSGTVETINNVKVILLMTNKGLRVESMTRY